MNLRNKILKEIMDNLIININNYIELKNPNFKEFDDIVANIEYEMYLYSLDYKYYDPVEKLTKIIINELVKIPKIPNLLENND